MNDFAEMKKHKNELISDIENSFQEMNMKLDNQNIEMDRMLRSHGESMSASFDRHYDSIEQKFSDQRNNVSKMMRKFSWETALWIIAGLIMWIVIFSEMKV